MYCDIMMYGKSNARHRLLKTMIYNYIDGNMPDWAKPTIKKLVKRGIIEGNENGERMFTDDLLRTLVIIDRAGLFDN